MTTLKVTGAVLVAIAGAVRRSSSASPPAQEQPAVGYESLHELMSRSAIVAIVLVLIAAALTALYFYSGTVSGTSMGGPVPLQSLPPKPALRSSTPARALPPSPPAPAASVATSAPAARPAASSPQILAVTLSAPVATGGQVVTGTVQTTPDVTSVDAQIMGYAASLSRVGAGYFALSYRVPALPPILRRTYTIVVTARNAAGRTASSSLPITIR